MSSNQGQQYVGSHKSGRLLESDSQLGRSGPWVPAGPCVLRIDIKKSCWEHEVVTKGKPQLEGDIDDGGEREDVSPHSSLFCGREL